MLGKHKFTSAQMLKGMLDNNSLASQYKPALNNGDRNLAQTYRNLRTKDFAAGIEPVAKAMLALSLIDGQGDYTSVVQPQESFRFPSLSNLRNPAPMVVVLNRRPHPCGCCTPRGWEEFSLTHGRLGLLSLTLQAGYAAENGQKAAMLGLAFSQSVTGQQRLNEAGFTVLNVLLNGFATTSTYSPVFRQAGVLMHSLGLGRLDDAVEISQTHGGQLDLVAGFPGASNYFADALPRLAEYLISLATNLNPAIEHKH